MRAAFRLISLAWLGAAVTGLAASPASAFGTISFMGQHAEHQNITRWALKDAGIQPRTLDMIAGTTWSFGAVGAPDNPLSGLVSFKAAHCDGGDHLDTPGYPQSAAEARRRLETCRQWMFDHLRRAVDDAGALAGETSGGRDGCRFHAKPEATAKCRVLADLGLAFHTAQDFYAHTNWTDRNPVEGPSVSDPPGLDQPARAPWIDPAAPGPFPPGLISGCWDGVPEAFFCGHGTAKARVAHADLNKDEGRIDWRTGSIGPGETPRGKIEGNFQHAVRAAVEDTAAKWAFFEAELSRRYGPQAAGHILCRVKQDRASRC